MNNIWSVYAVFEDDESTSWILIGNFTDNLIAKRSKEKWLSFFYSNKKILEEPVNWNPKNDDWFEDNEDFNWFDSAEYHLKLSEYKYIKDFQDIFIEEQPLDEDIFTENMPTDSISELAKQFNRDYKIKELIK